MKQSQWTMRTVRLSTTWISDGLIDFEYKVYQLLAYLQKINKLFGQKKIYPHLSDMLEQYRYLSEFKLQKEDAKSKFPQTITEIDLKNQTVQYETMYDDDEVLKTIDEIIDFALPRLKENIELGKELYEYASSVLELEPIGIVPLYRKEGYFLLREKSINQALIFYYKVKLIQTEIDKYRALETKFLGREKLSIVNTPENIKLKLIKNFKELPNPSSYMISAKEPLPLVPTWLPIAKRMLLRAVS